MGRERVLAWVESPLQLLAAAEYAHATGIRVEVAMRISGPQKPATAQALLDRGAPFSTVSPYYGIPWSLLSSHRHWIVGDAFSGQFQLAIGTLRPRAVTVVDDGIMTIRVARGLAGTGPFARPGDEPSGARALLGALARERLLALAATGSLDVYTAFGDHEALQALSARGIACVDNHFAWTRTTGQPLALASRTVLLGAAAVADGTLTSSRYLNWVADIARDAGTVSYLPHRREPAALVNEIRGLDGVVVVEAGIPVELALAGTLEPLDIVTLPSTAAVTLRTVLEGSRSTIRTERLAERVR
jgi:hypothetical protein